MTDIDSISRAARHAVHHQDWARVAQLAAEILRLTPNNPEGHFLFGLVCKASRQTNKAIESLERALALDEHRYDAAVELANQFCIARRNGEAAALLEVYTDKLNNSPRYLDMAGSIYNDIGLVHKSWPLYKKANELQPDIDLFQANLAAASVYLGKIDEAQEIFTSLLERFPGHRRNHYQLSRLAKARDDSHIRQMQEVLRTSTETPDKNIFMYYALGKELEDLGRFDEAFEYFKTGGDAVTSIARYEVANDIQLIDTIIETCSESWLGTSKKVTTQEADAKTPIFIVGLPRTGTTLTERIISSHSQVESLGETLFLQMVLRRESGVESVENMNSSMIRALADIDTDVVAKGYMDSVAYRHGDTPMFIDKLPFNFQYLGFIAKAWPDARIVYLHRNPMDACFSMYKQIFTWAYKYSYSLENLGQYYVAYERLRQHWHMVLKDRLIEVDYETLVGDQEQQTRSLLERLGLPFEQQCIDFDQNTAPSATASSVQVREKIYKGSVKNWRHYEAQLAPLKDYLEQAGIAVD
jgi:tetratricopeptide (TPR) repeat protein|tara:strand:+ start:4891 stop:6471 length:1581 start_codon:yes stop_codon:yes gene_type:complete